MKHEAWISPNWEEEGLTWVVVAKDRGQADGWLEVGAFRMDVWCLGVTDAFWDEMDRAQFAAYLDDQLPPEARAPLEPACARTLIEGAAAYAQGLGFLPAREFRKARKVLHGIDAAACAREFSFGREGRPCFVAGPDDEEARVSRVLAVLRARFGEEGFEFIDAAGEADDTSEEDAIDELISEFFLYIENGRGPNPALTAFEANGFLAGLRLLPEMPERETWMTAIWGGAPFVPVFAHNLEKANVLEGMWCRLDQIAEDFAENHFHAPLPTVDESDHVEMAQAYCAGVCRGLQMQPKIAAWFRSHPASAAAMTTLERLSSAATAEVVAAPPWGKEGQQPGDYIGGLVGAIFARTEELRPPPA